MNEYHDDNFDPRPTDDVRGHDDGSGDGGFELFDFYVAQLEAYLDGELSREEAVAVRQRLVQEEAYAAALGRLHAQREQRAEIFASIERDETTAEAAARITASARQMSLRGRLQPAAAAVAPAAPAARGWPLWAKVALGMAACILVGFGAGLVGVYDFGDAPAVPSPTQYAAGEQGEGFTGWVRYSNGERVLELPAEDRPMGEPRILPADRTSERPPR